MTPAELKEAVSETNPHFFTSKTMRFFGDRMSNYGVRRATVETWSGQVECWELYRKKPVKHGLQSSAFFDCETFERRFPKKESSTFYNKRGGLSWAPCG